MTHDQVLYGGMAATGRQIRLIGLFALHYKLIIMITNPITHALAMAAFMTPYKRLVDLNLGQRCLDMAFLSSVSYGKYFF